MSDEEASRFEQTLSETGNTPLLTAHNDLESYFISADHLHALNPRIPITRIRELIEQATQEAATESVEAMINIRTQEAFKRRQGGGPAINHGAIATQAQSDYKADPTNCRRGKIVLRRLKALLQHELRASPRIYFPSSHLKHVALTSAAASIWSGGDA
jgi:hypothetical protein